MTTKDMAFTRKVLRPAVGRINGVRRAISIGFDPADFERIAVARNASTRVIWHRPTTMLLVNAAR
jgi:hypothetical protein